MKITFNLGGVNPLKGPALKMEAIADDGRTFKVMRESRKGFISVIERYSIAEREELFASARKQGKAMTLFNSDGSDVGELNSLFYQKIKFSTSDKRQLAISQKEGTLMPEFVGEGFRSTVVGKEVLIELQDVAFLAHAIIWGYSLALQLMEC